MNRWRKWWQQWWRARQGVGPTAPPSPKTPAVDAAVSRAEVAVNEMERAAQQAAETNRVLDEVEARYAWVAAQAAVRRRHATDTS